MRALVSLYFLGYNFTFYKNSLPRKKFSPPGAIIWVAPNPSFFHDVGGGQAAGSFLLYVSVVTLCVQSHFMCPALTLCVRSYFVNFSLHVSKWKIFVCSFYVWYVSHHHQLFFRFGKKNALVATDCIILQIFSKKIFSKNAIFVCFSTR